MALITEDGTGVADANCFADVAAVRSYATNRGVTLSADDTVVSALIYKATDYLNGIKLGPLSLAFPSDSGELCGTPVVELISRLNRATGQLCIEQNNSVDLAPARSGAFIVEDTFGPVTIKFSDKRGGGDGTAPIMPAVSALLDPILEACGDTGYITVIRV